jgi:hypothetical protein
MVAPVLEDLAARHAGVLKSLKVDVDEEPELAARSMPGRSRCS